MKRLIKNKMQRRLKLQAENELLKELDQKTDEVKKECRLMDINCRAYFKRSPEQIAMQRMKYKKKKEAIKNIIEFIQSNNITIHRKILNDRLRTLTDKEIIHEWVKYQQLKRLARLASFEEWSQKGRREK